jgi:glycosyltransferase involved in cell wall biosynthesis
MRILIDLQGAQTSSRFRGIGRYSLDVSKSLLRNSGEHEVSVLLSGFLPDQVEHIRSELDDLTTQDHILVWEGVGPTAYVDSRNQWRRQVSELIREAYICQLKPDVVILTSFFEGYGDDFAASIGLLNSSIPVAVIFYDLIPLLYPKDYLLDLQYASWYKERIRELKKANFLLAISDASKKEAVKYLSFNDEHVVNISSAVSESFSRFVPPLNYALFLNNLGITKPFLMYTSATDARKNHLRLIEAYSKLDSSIRDAHQLVFAGGLTSEHLKKFEGYALRQGLAPNELLFTGELSDDELKMLYSQCTAFIFPSWHEGFGLPILEAMQFNKAIIASNKSSIPEIIVCEEALFDPYDVMAITAKIKQVLVDQDFRITLEKNSAERAQAFSWDKTAKTTLQFLERSIPGALGGRLIQDVEENPLMSVDYLISQITQLNLPHDETDLLHTAQAIDLNFRISAQRQLLIDISVLVEQDAKTGIQRVVRNILREWLLNPPKDYSVQAVYATMDQPYRYARKFTAYFLGRPQATGLTDDVVEFSAGDSFLGLDLLYPHLALKHRHFYQKMRNHGVNVKFVIYDLLPIQLPQYVVMGAPEAHAEWVKMVTQFDGAICISQSVANELKNWLAREAITPSKSFAISWFYLGADPEQSSISQEQALQAEQAEVLQKLESKLSFLCVGTLEPRKGHVQVLDAFEQLWAEGQYVNLVFVGKRGWKVEDLVNRLENHSEKGKHLFWFEGISDLYLNQIYKSCSCLIAASEGEGFGLPLIEAAHQGIPIIARSIPVFHEVAGEYAYYFEGKLPKDLTQAVQNWITLSAEARQPESKKMPWSTWRESAWQLLQALNKE